MIGTFLGGDVAWIGLMALRYDGCEGMPLRVACCLSFLQGVRESPETLIAVSFPPLWGFVSFPPRLPCHYRISKLNIGDF